MIFQKKRFITLLEVLIVVGIIAFIGSFAAINVTRLNQEQQALNAMSEVVNLLKTATDLMTLVNFDSEIHFSKKNDSFEVEMIPKSSISPLVLPLIPLKPLKIDSMDQITFKDGIENTTLTDQFSLHFESKGFIMNRGVLTFTRGKTEGSIIIYGYPTALSIIKGAPPSFPKTPDEIIQAVTEQTRQETVEAVVES